MNFIKFWFVDQGYGILNFYKNWWERNVRGDVIFKFESNGSNTCKLIKQDFGN